MCLILAYSVFPFSSMGVCLCMHFWLQVVICKSWSSVNWLLSDSFYLTWKEKKTRRSTCPACLHRIHQVLYLPTDYPLGPPPSVSILCPEAIASFLIYVEMSCQAAHSLLNTCALTSPLKDGRQSEACVDKERGVRGVRCTSLIKCVVYVSPNNCCQYLRSAPDLRTFWFEAEF